MLVQIMNPPLSCSVKETDKKVLNLQKSLGLRLPLGYTINSNGIGKGNERRFLRIGQVASNRDNVENSESIITGMKKAQKSR